MENNEKQEKIEGGELHFGRQNREERPHGKIYRWFDNFWYHHKWKTIIIAFFAITILVCTLQMCQREEEKGDIGVLLAGPYYTAIANEQLDAEALQKSLNLALPADYDENGTKKVEMTAYALYSEAQIKELAANDVQVNTQINSENYTKFFQYIQTGEVSILFLDPWLYEELLSSGVLMNLTEIIEAPKAGAVTDENGTLYGVRLADTELYKTSAIGSLPEDTVLCLARPIVGGKSSKEAEYQKAKEYFAALVK